MPLHLGFIMDVFLIKAQLLKGRALTTSESKWILFPHSGELFQPRLGNV